MSLRERAEASDQDALANRGGRFPERPLATRSLDMSSGKLRVAWAMHQSGHYESAERDYEAILAKEPNHPDALQLLGILKNQLGQYEAAVQVMTRALGLRPDSADLHHNLGAALSALGLHEQAARCLQATLRLDPTRRDALRKLADAWFASAQLDKAEDCCRQLRELNSHDSHAAQLTERIAAERRRIGVVMPETSDPRLSGWGFQPQ